MLLEAHVRSMQMLSCRLCGRVKLVKVGMPKYKDLWRPLPREHWVIMSAQLHIYQCWELDTLETFPGCCEQS